MKKGKKLKKSIKGNLTDQGKLQELSDKESCLTRTTERKQGRLKRRFRKPKVQIGPNANGSKMIVSQILPEDIAN